MASPPADASRVQRLVKALKTLEKKGEIQTAVELIHKDIDFPMLHQTSRQVGIGDRILKQLAQLKLTHDQSLVAQRGHYLASASAHDRSNLVLFDVYNHRVLFDQHQEPDEAKVFGLCLGSAP
ncbi:hypothetical protein GJ744_005666 [Endocarpon pusillum]|uniref:Uncharacterized protein n=1 Tax=Endocarpon pusillum TaxID=364733 RepID=A0A8H7A7P2_9EURO|nr:hypothetical protein GJ744_005666 [Endocarpon pusillum]